jgi:hypothetical protein
MGWKLLSWFWRPEPDPEPEFVAARLGRAVVAPVPIRTIYANEDDRVKPFGPKPPEEVDFVNFDFSARLAAVGDTIATIVSVEPSGPDEAIVVDEVTNEDGIVSARWSGGTADTEYLLPCLITTVGGRTWKLTGSVAVVADA